MPNLRVNPHDRRVEENVDGLPEGRPQLAVSGGEGISTIQVPAKAIYLSTSVQVSVTAARGPRDRAGKELHRQMQSHAPRFFIVRGVWET